nr:MAG TPA: hypothetical protein [Microviridae sp.]
MNNRERGALWAPPFEQPLQTGGINLSRNENTRFGEQQRARGPMGPSF